MPSQKKNISMESDKVNNIRIRPLVIDDFNELIRLWENAHLPYKPAGRDQKEKIAAEIKKPTAIFLVAVRDDKIVGSVLGTHDGRKGWINRLAVLPSYQQTGIAKRLLQEVERRIYALGIEIIACLIEEWNENSIAFFEQQGYESFEGIKYMTKRRYPEV